jgi:RNA polymerase primary sigma factor
MSPDEERRRAAELAELRSAYRALAEIPLAKDETERRDQLARLGDAERALKKARDYFVSANLRLVVTIASGYATGIVPLSDLIQEGNLGLMTAVDRFDHTRNVRFCTYASWWIRHHITRAVGDLSRAVRVPSHMAQAASKLNKVQRQFEALHGRAPTTEELAALSDYGKGKVKRALTVNTGTFSLEAPSADSGPSMRDALIDRSTSTPDAMEHAEALEAVATAFTTLPSMEQQILRERFAFDGDEPLTLREIGKLHHLSRERIRQLQNQALERIREEIES